MIHFAPQAQRTPEATWWVRVDGPGETVVVSCEGQTAAWREYHSRIEHETINHQVRLIHHSRQIWQQGRGKKRPPKAAK